MSSLLERMDRLQIAENSLVFLGLGQVGVAIRGPWETIYIDPYLTYNDGNGGRLDRLFPPPIDPHEIANAAVVLVTHAHIDHFDPQTLAPIAAASPQALFVGPHSCDFIEAGIPAERTVVPPTLKPLSIASATVTPIPSAHTELDRSEEGYPYFGYVIEWNGVTLYHAGDTVIYDQHQPSATPGLLDTLGNWSIDVMFIPINGRGYFRTAQGLKGNTDAREAAVLAETLDVKLVVPTHYDLLAGNGANPAHFVDIVYRLNPSRRHHLLRPGELLCYVGGN
ncbi:MAG: MBL fold metallo-hydrolase [Trueperaceae bacterium]